MPLVIQFNPESWISGAQCDANVYAVVHNEGMPRIYIASRGFSHLCIFIVILLQSLNAPTQEILRF